MSDDFVLSVPALGAFDVGVTDSFSGNIGNDGQLVGTVVKATGSVTIHKYRGNTLAGQEQFQFGTTPAPAQAGYHTGLPSQAQLMARPALVTALADLQDVLWAELEAHQPELMPSPPEQAAISVKSTVRLDRIMGAFPLYSPLDSSLTASIGFYSDAACKRLERSLQFSWRFNGTPLDLVDFASVPKAVDAMKVLTKEIMLVLKEKVIAYNDLNVDALMTLWQLPAPPAPPAP